MELRQSFSSSHGSSHLGMDGGDEVRDECHSLEDILLIRFTYELTTVEVTLLCPKCSKVLEKYQYEKKNYSSAYSP